MPVSSHKANTLALGVVVALSLWSTGCFGHHVVVPPDSQIPRELDKVTMPPYVIEPPDILLIDAVRAVPVPPHKIEPLDSLLIQVPGLVPPIEGIFGVAPEGTIDLGAQYGVMQVAGMTVEQIKAELEKRLKAQGAKQAQASVSLAQSQALQQIQGEHLVRQDGTVSLGVYGAVYVTGMTIEDAKKAIETHLAKFLLRPVLSVDVLAYNSKVIYVITDGAGTGEPVFRLPHTGNETVLDALSQIQGLPPTASKKRIWVARPAPAGSHTEPQVLPVDWRAITECGQTATNYQLFPGDRIYVKSDPWLALDNALAKVLTPIERVFGAVLLGNSTVRSIENSGSLNNGLLGNGLVR